MRKIFKRLASKSRVLLGAALAVGIISSMAVPAGSVAAAGTNLSLTPQNQTVDAGNTFSVVVAVDTDTASRGFQAGLQFDASKLQCDSVSLTDTFYAPWATANGAMALPVGLPAVIDNTAGTVSIVGVTLMGGTGGPVGSGNLITYNFTAEASASGSADITIINGIVNDTAGGELTLNLNNGTVDITALLPDLVVSSVSTSWVDPATGTYNIDFTVTNNGSVTADASTTSISIDGGEVATEVCSTLAAGASESRTAGPFIISGVNDSVQVCADKDNVVTEGNETNQCANTDIDSFAAKMSISPATQSVIPGQTVTVTIGVDATAATRGAQAGITFDSSLLQCESATLNDTFYTTWAASNGSVALPIGIPPVIDNTTGNVSTMGIALVGGSGGPVGSGTMVTLEFTALAQGVADIELTDALVMSTGTDPLSPLQEEYAQVEIATGQTPDLIVSQKYEEVDPQTGQYTITYEIKNDIPLTNYAIAGASTTSISIDGIEVATRPCPELGPHESFTETVGPFTMTGTSDDIEICADCDNDVNEGAWEGNNCRTNTLTDEPDLIVTSVIEDWAPGFVGSKYNVTFTVKNVGAAEAAASITSIKADGVEKATDSCPALVAGATHTATVGPFTITGEVDEVEVCADKSNVVAETDETNNCRDNLYSMNVSLDGTIVQGNIAAEIILTPPDDIYDWVLHVGQNNKEGTLNVKCNTSWRADISDDEPTTAGHMTGWNGATFNTAKQLAEPFIAKCDAEGTEVTLPGPGMIAIGEVMEQNGNDGEDFELEFNQEVLWSDGILTDGNAYRIVLTFSGSPSF